MDSLLFHSRKQQRQERSAEPRYRRPPRRLLATGLHLVRVSDLSLRLGLGLVLRQRLLRGL
jgi:hypothetical protein